MSSFQQQPLTDLSLNQSPNTTESASSSSASSPAIQQLHQAAPTTNSSLEMQRQLLAQKLVEKSTGSFTSPTDAMMTPCSKKLAAHKQKAYGKSQPRLLSKAFSGIAKEGKENKATTSSSSSGLGKNPFGADS
ncbi:hypothetical protein L873DRAFT_1785411 [Choiromyces venosus 120613-1]|uniref:Uncharacterized protein n=1 Tax=Choiromyces venosus 120613-1 TaxID=1336337 RepID=A0A3N4K5M3_9PEZI|nr:hypothetical protein L873DRAFT_1785411 [Choiromyces venosus 120613-1]